jgi:hypothetical protein
MLKGLVAVFCELSLTLTVKAAAPAAVGVPLTVPLADNESPAGREPLISDHEYPPAPPLAERDSLNATPTVPFGRDVVVIVNGGSAIVML